MENHKAYIEILPGRFEQHVYKTSTQAYVEIQYAIAFDGKWLEPALTHDQHPGTTLTAINNWAEFTATSDQISRLNLMLRSHLLSNKFSQVSQLMTDTVLLTNKIYDTVFFNGLYDGIAINSPVFIRGNQYNLTSPVPRKFLSVLPSVDSVFQSRGSGRMDLAETILNPDNPLTARVMVNRIWHYLFGKGIVETTDNFGLFCKESFHHILNYSTSWHSNFNRKDGLLKNG
ncbi:MAG: DUF1553 domain-containing protein [Saprospiraceae bacterium]|nr:DUF1553 domain-containing protein [Saprospiraceae bacterium]